MGLIGARRLETCLICQFEWRSARETTQRCICNRYRSSDHRDTTGPSREETIKNDDL